MKKNSFILLMVAIAAATVVSGCQRDPVGPDVPENPVRDVVTATIEQGQQTRTHIEWETLTGGTSATPVVKWTDGDETLN